MNDQEWRKAKGDALEIKDKLISHRLVCKYPDSKLPVDTEILSLEIIEKTDWKVIKYTGRTFQPLPNDPNASYKWVSAYNKDENTYEDFQCLVKGYNWVKK